MRRTSAVAVAVLLAACSPAEPQAPEGADAAASVVAPGAAPPEPAPAAGTAATRAAASSAGDPDQDPPAPQRIPADPDRPVRPLVAEIAKGGLTLAAFQDTMVERMMRLDADGDGALSRSEVEASGRGGRMLTAADADRDGRVTQAEVRAGAAMMFGRMDQNGDGRVTEDERPQL